MAYQNPAPRLTTGKPGHRVSLAEVHSILADDGYSGNDRLDRLKQVLSELTQDTADDRETLRMRDAVKELIANYQDDEPIAQKTL
jgi:hypothetical protein